MRLVSYNILNGGEGRADPLAEVILARKPDVVALMEADEPAVVARIAQRLHMESVSAVGHKHTVALLSRWPIVESVNHALLNKKLTKCFMEATVRDSSGCNWLIGIVHLHAHAKQKDDKIRQSEIEAICDIFAQRRKRNVPHLLAGDFNSDSPIQRIDPALCKPATQKAWQANGGDLPRAAVQKILDNGYVDSLHRLHPEEARRRGTFSTQFPGQRVDYVFSFGFGERLKSAWIEQDRLAQFAGDHFPIGVEISL